MGGYASTTDYVSWATASAVSSTARQRDGTTGAPADESTGNDDAGGSAGRAVCSTATAGRSTACGGVGGSTGTGTHVGGRRTF